MTVDISIIRGLRDWRLGLILLRKRVVNPPLCRRLISDWVSWIIRTHIRIWIFIAYKKLVVLCQYRKSRNLLWTLDQPNTQRIELESSLKTMNQELYEAYQIKLTPGTDLQWINVHLLYRLEGVIGIPVGKRIEPVRKRDLFRRSKTYQGLTFQEI